MTERVGETATAKQIAFLNLYLKCHAHFRRSWSKMYCITHTQHAQPCSIHISIYTTLHAFIHRNWGFVPFPSFYQITADCLWTPLKHVQNESLICIYKSRKWFTRFVTIPTSLAKELQIPAPSSRETWRSDGLQCSACSLWPYSKETHGMQ